MQLLIRLRWLFVSLLLVYAGNLEQYAVARIIVDLAQSGPQALRTGFLHGPAPEKDSPRGKLVSALKPDLWRAANAQTLIRAREYGARPMLVLSDLWGYPRNDWLKHGSVYDHLPAWHKFVRHGTKLAADYNWIWDIWNEPNLASYFDGSEAQYDATFITAAKAIREQYGDKVQITGPSLSHFDLPRMTRFAEACMKAGVKVEVLNWHEFVPAQNATRITRHLIKARARFLNNPKFAALGVKELMITETIDPRQWLQPAAIVAYRAALEAGRADAFARACWRDGAQSSCWNGSMDGLFTAKSEPRAAWWAERAMVPDGSRVFVNTPMAWHAVGQRHSLMLARFQDKADAVRLEIDGLDQPARKLRLCLRLIPDSGFDPVPELAPPQCREVSVNRGRVITDIPAAPPGAALWVTWQHG